MKRLLPPRRQSSRLSSVECIKVLAEGERHIEELQLQEKSFVALVPDAEAELVRLRAQVAEFQGSANVHQRHTKQRICPVEDMPGLIPAELSVWMEDCQADVQEGLSVQPQERVVSLELLRWVAVEMGRQQKGTACHGPTLRAQQRLHLTLCPLDCATDGRGAQKSSQMGRPMQIGALGDARRSRVALVHGVLVVAFDDLSVLRE